MSHDSSFQQQITSRVLALEATRATRAATDSQESGGNLDSTSQDGHGTAAGSGGAQRRAPSPTFKKRPAAFSDGRKVARRQRTHENLASTAVKTALSSALAAAPYRYDNFRND